MHTTTLSRNLLTTLVAGIMLTAIPLAAHHAFAAEFDDKQPVTLSGKVVKFEFMNPHSWIHMDIQNGQGQTVRWRVETGSTNALLISTGAETSSTMRDLPSASSP